MPSIPQTKGLLPAANSQLNRETGGALGKDDFLKLFSTQMAHQDPMKPMEDSQFMGQMASFSTLEQVSKLAAASEELAARMTMSSAIGFIGRTVTYTDAAGAPSTGVVERVSTEGGKPVLTVAGVGGVDPSKITSVA